MALFRRTATVFFAVLALSACAHDEEIAAEEGADAATAAAAQQAIADVETNMPAYMSDGGVEIYSLDGGMPAVSGGIHPSAASLYRGEDGGVASAHDSSVTVYPFDGGGSLSAMSGHAPQPMMEMGGAYGYDSSVDVSGMQSVMDSAPAVLYFPHNSAALSLEGRRMLDEFSAMQKSRGGSLDVQGHASSKAVVADPVQKRIVNLKVSMDRAYSVSKELIRDGVDPQAIRTTALGDAYPAQPQGGMDADAASRRVEIRKGQ